MTVRFLAICTHLQDLWLPSTQLPILLCFVFFYFLASCVNPDNWINEIPRYCIIILDPSELLKPWKLY